MTQNIEENNQFKRKEGKMMKKVLVADDDESNICLLKSLLEEEGCSVTAASNGQEAFDKAHDDPPDMIVSDTMMPVMDGYMLCRKCKADKQLRDTPFVFYTATYTEPKDEKFALSLGADSFVRKLQSPEILINVLREIWEKRSRKEIVGPRPFGKDMEFFRQYNEVLFNKLEHRMVQLEIMKEEYRLAFEHVTDIVFSTDINLNVVKVSPSVERMLGYKPDDFMGRSIYNMPNILVLSSDSVERALAETSLVMKGETIQNSVYSLSAKDGSVKYIEVSGSPIMQDGKIIGIAAVAREITKRRQAEEDLLSAAKRLRRLLEGVVLAIAKTVEVKDPYTAGHQRRVADLSEAIAVEMGFSADRTEFVSMAANIHDIGKIAVPTEILSMPRRLTATEFEMVKLHPQCGYDILKDIEFPWPVADVILQHHERMDGSGYPQGLKGDSILLEARIIAVADVVESMASYRPYRPALGIEVAIEEIEEKKGKLYDPDVVNACLRLFNEKGFRLKD